jgi:hypothetical protein
MRGKNDEKENGGVQAAPVFPVFPRSFVSHRYLSLVALCCVLGAIPASANTLSVGVGATYATIGAAVSAASNGDTILVVAGTYTGAGNYNINVTKSISIRSVSGTSVTTIDMTGASAGNLINAFTVSGDATVDILGFTIKNGYGHNGGGIAVTGGTVTITQCVFTGNTAMMAGGALYVYANPTANVTVLQSQFINNTAGNLANSGFGGAIEVLAVGGTSTSETLTVVNSTFTGNTATYDGGAIDISGPSATVPTVTVTNSSFSTNAANGLVSSALSGTIPAPATGHQPGVIDSNLGSVTVTNSILYGDSTTVEYSTLNDPATSGGGSVTITYSNIQGGFSGTGNINFNPQYVNGPGGDLRLQYDSPAIQAGTTTGEPSVDLLGNPRAAHADMGSYEYFLKATLGLLNYAVNVPFSGEVGTLDDASADLAPPSAFTVTINWGDGSSATAGTVTQPGGVGTSYVITGTHTYTSVGNFVITLTISFMGVEVVGPGPGPGSSGSGTAGPATQFASSAPSSVMAGVPFSLVVQAQDQFGNIATGYRGTVQFYTSQGAGSVVPANYTFTTADNGTHIFVNGVTLTQVGEQAVSMFDTSNSAVAGVAVVTTVTPGPAASFFFFTPSVATIGNAVSFTVEVADQYGDLASNYLGTVLFTSSDPSATLPADYTFTAADAGAHVFTNGATFQTSGNQTITATDMTNTSVKTTSKAISVSGVATHFSVTSNLTVSGPGTAVSYTVTALTAGNLTATAYTGTMHFTSSDGAAILPANVTLPGGTGTFRVTYNTLGLQTVTVTDTGNSSITGTSSAIDLEPAVSLTVTTVSDVAGHTGTSLRDAITTSNNSATGGAIAFTVTGTIMLTGNLPPLTQSVSITGPGPPTSLVIDGATLYQPFNVGPGITVSMSGLTIQNGNDTSTAPAVAGGGAIFNQGILNLSSCVLDHNQQTGTGSGGAIQSVSGSILTMNQCTVSNNVAISSATIDNNVPCCGNAGGVGLDQGATGTIMNSTLFGNTAVGGVFIGGIGGGIKSNGNLTIIGCTITGNQVTDPGAHGQAYGGAIYVSVFPNLNQRLTLTIMNSTITGNQAPGTATAPDDGYGGVAVEDLPYVVIDMTNTILAGNQNGDYSTNGINGGSNNMIGGNPQLGPLANNGGPTQTMLPLLSSPVLGAGTTVGAPATDQRGYPRTINGNIDIGAVEFQGATLSASGGTPQSAQISTPFATPLQATATETTSGVPLTGYSVAFAAPAPSSGATATVGSGGTTDSNGQVSVAATADNLPGGPYNVTATFSPGAITANFALSNTGGPTATSVTANPAAGSTWGAPVTFTASVFSAAVGASPTGMITFVDATTGTTLASNMAVNGSGQASVTIANLPVAVHTIAAFFTPTGGAFLDSIGQMTGFAVGKATLTITPDSGKSKTYATTFSAFTGTVSGLQLTDAGTATYASTGAAASANVGTYNITSAFNFTSGLASNYNITLNTAANGLTVNTATLTVTPDGGKSKGYGTVFSAFTGVVTGLVTANGDAGTATYSSSGAMASAAIGNYNITSAFNFTSGSPSNYSVTLNTATNGLSVGKATLTVTPDGSKSKTYGTVFSAFTGTVTGLATANGDAGTAAFSSSGAAAAANAGTYDITSAFNLTSGLASNYTIVLNTATNGLTVNTATLTVTPDGSKSKTYGTVFSAFTGTVTGLVTTNGDAGTATYSSSGAAASANAGTYNIISAFNFTSGLSSNYSVTLNTATNGLTANTATLTVTPDGGKSKTYGTAFSAFTGTVTGLVTSNGDAGAASYSSSGAVMTAGVGAYNIVGTGFNFTSGSSSNYSITLNTTTNALTVNAATLTVTPNNGLSKTYGTTFSAFTGVVSGLQNSDAATGIYSSTGAAATAGVGSYSVVATGTNFTSGSASNYSITLNTATNALTVNAATLTVTANNVSRAYGVANPMFTASYSGFQNGDTTAVLSGAPSLTTTATASSPTGPYTVTAAAGNLSATNYIFSFVNGTLTIANVPLTVTASGATRAYGAADQLSYSITGFVNGDTISAVSGAPSLSSAAVFASPPGTYTVTATLGTLASTNYTFTFVPGTLIVTKQAVGMGLNGITPGTTALPGQTFTLSFIVVGVTGDAAPSGTISYSVDGGATQTAALTGGVSASTATVALGGLASGTHIVLNSYNGDGNYLGTTPTPLTLTVSKITSQLSVAVSPGNTASQGQNFILNFTVTGSGQTAAPGGTVSCTVDGTAVSQTATITAGSGSLTLSGLAGGTHTVACNYSGDSNYPAAVGFVTLTVQQGPPALNAGGIVSAAGVNGGVAPGGLISLYGTNLQGSTSLGAANALSEPLPITLGGTQVLVNGASAPLLYVSPGQINCQAPYETPVGTPVQVVVVANGVSSQPLMVPFSSYAPTVFLYPRTATSNDPVITHADNTLVTPSSPAQPGEVLTIWTTGAGKLNNQPLDGAGAPTSPLATTVDTPSVTVGGASTTVQFSGLAPGFVGLLQINVQMPAVFPASTATPPSLPLVITFPGGVSAPVSLWVQ